MADKEDVKAPNSGDATQSAPGQQINVADTLKADFEKLKNDLQDKEAKLLKKASLTYNQPAVLSDRLAKMIDYAVKRHDWYVDQCHRLLQIGLALIATGGAIAAILGKSENVGRITQILGWLFALSLFFTGLRLVHLYNSHIATDHPYRKLVNIRSWYFKYQFPQSLVQSLSRSAQKAKAQVAQEAENIGAFFTSFLDHATQPENFIREDIEQVSILLLLQGYRYEQVKKMSGSLYKGLCISTAFFLLLIASLMFELGSHKGNNSNQPSPVPTPAPSPILSPLPTLTPTPSPNSPVTSSPLEKHGNKKTPAKELKP